MDKRDSYIVEAGFDAAAAGYDSPSLQGFGKGAARLVELAGLQSGQRVLDVGTGTGNAAIAAAAAVGPHGQIIGIEIASEMRAAALRKVQIAGLTNIEILEADASAPPFDGGTFDVVISASAIYTLPDIPAALEEWKRVLRPAGLVAFSTLGSGTDKLYLDLLAKYGIQIPPLMPLQRVDSPEKCADLLNGAGFCDIRVTKEQLGYFLVSGEQCWQIVWYTGARIPLMHMPPHVVDLFKADFIAASDAARTEQGIRIDWPAIFSLARKS